MTYKPHTPAPWVVNPIRNTVETREGLDGSYRRTVAEVGSGWHEHNQPEAEANARLIAAAPDLLRAARIAHEAMKNNPEWDVPNTMDILEKAIAKAEGT